MIDQVLVESILTWLRTEAKGNKNALPRKWLRKYLILKGLLSPLTDTDPKVFEREDRRMRRACESIPTQCGSCSRGYFLIVDAEDRRIAQGQLAAPAASMFERKRCIERAAPQGQISLFGEEA